MGQDARNSDSTSASRRSNYHHCISKLRLEISIASEMLPRLRNILYEGLLRLKLNIYCKCFILKLQKKLLKWAMKFHKGLYVHAIGISDVHVSSKIITVNLNLYCVLISVNAVLHYQSFCDQRL